MSETYNYGILSGGTGSFGSIQYTDNASGTTKEFMKTGSNGPALYNLTSVSASTTVEGGAATFASVTTAGAVIVGGDLTVQGTTTTVDSTTINLSRSVTFEGLADDYETTLTIVEPTADREIKLANAGGFLQPFAAASTTQISATPDELNVLDGITSTTAELNILDGVTSTAAELNILDGVTATAAELNLVDGSSAGTVVNSKAVVYGSSGEVNATTVSASSYVSASSFEVDGQASISYDSSALDFSTGGAGAALSATMFSSSVELQGPSMEVSGAAKVGSLTINGTAVTATAAEINDLAGNAVDASDFTKLSEVTATSAELNIMDGVTATTAELNILDGVTATAAELNIMDGVTATTAELNIMDGVTSTAAELNLVDGSQASTVVNSKAVIYGTDGEVKSKKLQLSSSNSYTIDLTGDGQNDTDYVSIISVYDANSNNSFVSGVTWNSTLGNFALRRDYTDDEGESVSEFADLEVNSLYMGENGSISWSPFGSASFDKSGILSEEEFSIKGDLLTIGAQQGTNVTMSLGYKEGNYDGAFIYTNEDGNEELFRIEATVAMTGSHISGAVAFSGSALNLGSTTNVTAILDEDGLTSDSATALATQQSIKAYVDSQLGATTLDFQGDEGAGSLAIDLDSETLSIIGTSNEIETAGSGNQIQIGLPDNVTIGGILNVSSHLTASGDIVAGDNITLKTGGNTVTLGESGNKLSAVYATNVYTGDFHMKNERGDWTLFEESDYLRIRNNKTGQEFRMDMTPIEE